MSIIILKEYIMPVFFTRENDYAIRICAYLAGKEDTNPVAISDISDKLFITRPFATKIIYYLKQSNIVETTQGKMGGVCLKADPGKLSIYDILKALGFHSSLNECLYKPGFCPMEPTCKIHTLFIDEEERLINSLKSKHISEFVIKDDDLIPEK
jgi:Rrf2 family nitric oxide-sensitive transcriptional repressor